MSCLPWRGGWGICVVCFGGGGGFWTAISIKSSSRIPQSYGGELQNMTYMTVVLALQHEGYMRCSAKSLVRELLTTNPGKRLTAGQALKHSWFTASLQSNEDLRLARRNMKRHLRLRFKVCFMQHTHPES